MTQMEKRDTVVLSIQGRLVPGTPSLPGTDTNPADAQVPYIKGIEQYIHTHIK